MYAATLTYINIYNSSKYYIMLAVWPRLPFRQGFALISLVFQSYCWWEALFCSCILQSVEQGLQPLRAGGQQGGEGEGYWQQRWRLRSRLCSLRSQEHILGRQRTPCQGCSCQKKEQFVLQLERILFQIFYYLIAGHLLESKSLMEVLILVKILLTWLSFMAFTWCWSWWPGLGLVL